ncbi:SH3 domain-containing protein [Maliponia aquimaris]|uniref:Bacterial SH3 domain protein n=1 Tax=Maliponia aquimaris TaxID=1673631 RepID=A0A238JSZ2_9RHOB|nr:SH3 domain-containing protein [Maliponia aquimaris]SMX33779.1 Bacterial SH3 domain protein [Maliponia aquimaris]
MLRLALALILACGGAAAQDAFPHLHDVTGVAANDVLNVRAGPGPGHPVIGELAHDARAVEVVRVEGGWGQVNVYEQAGWASMRFLAPRVDGDIGNVGRLVCGGTEPFWGIDARPGQVATVKTPMNYDPGETYSVGLLQRVYNPLQKWLLQGSDGPRTLSMVVARTYCDNGMSDNEYGFDATLIVTGPEGYVFSGCCRLRD